MISFRCRRFPDPRSLEKLHRSDRKLWKSSQFACSYCNPAFSSTWVNDIRRHGPYNGLVSDGRNHFTHTHDSSQLYKFGETNPYVEAFFDWWERDLHRTLQELRITGGEPLMSGYTWQLIEWFKQNQGRSNTKLAINSNLGIDRDKIKDFIIPAPVGEEPKNENDKKVKVNLIGVDVMDYDPHKGYDPFLPLSQLE